MKILMVSPLPPPMGGMATWTEKYLKQCMDKKLSICLVNTALISKNFEAGVNKRNIIDEVKRNIHIVCDFVRRFKRYEPDIVHINSSCSKYGMLREAVCIFYAKNKKKKILLHCHCDVEDMLGKGKTPRKVFMWLAQNANYVLCLNNRSLQYVQRIVEKDKCAIVANFVEKEKQKTERTISKKIRKCIYLGHVRREKGVFELIEMAKRLPNIQFELIGPVSDEIKKSDIPNNVCLHGTMQHEQAMKFLKQSDVFVFPSYSEGFSVAMLEAMQSGLPIIATDVGANRDMIEDKGGIIVDSKNVEALCKGISFLEEPDIRKEMSDWNCLKVQENYTLDVVFGKIQLLYEKMM